MAVNSPTKVSGKPVRVLAAPVWTGAAALELVDRDGTLSMPALARSLGVQVSSLYHHVDGRAGVIGLVRDLVTAGIDASGFASTREYEFMAALVGRARAGGNSRQ